MSELDLSELPNDVIRAVTCETVQNQLKTRKYRMDISSASKAGENNFIGVVYRLSFSRKDGTCSNSLILKVAPQDYQLRVQFLSRAMFLREIYLYEEILSCFRQFEKSRGISEEDVFRKYPKCPRTFDIEPNESLYLEDMSVNGFGVVDRHTEEIMADHVFLVMECLGKFHAISLALKDQQPEKFQQLTSNFDEVLIQENLNRAFFTQQTQVILEVLSDVKDAYLLARVKELITDKDLVDIAIKCLEESTHESATVITHGDSWQNNVMFKTDKNGKPIDICLLDWQVSRNSSPITDITYFLFSCTTKELRDDHFEDFLKAYHESLSNHLQRLGSDPEKVFSFRTMQEHLRKYAKFGFILAAILALPLSLREKGHVINMDEFANNLANNREVGSNLFSSRSARGNLLTRLHGVVTDAFRLGYI